MLMWYESALPSLEFSGVRSHIIPLRITVKGMHIGVSSDISSPKLNINWVTYSSIGKQPLLQFSHHCVSLAPGIT